MCDICGRQFCPASCPGEDGYDILRGASEGECFCCGLPLYAGDRIFARGNTLLCEACAENADLEAVLDINGCKDVAELFEDLGFLRDVL